MTLYVRALAPSANITVITDNSDGTASTPA